jgi:hypothetical protein
MTVDRQPLERVRAAVDAVLRGTETDLRVQLVGPWHALSEERTSPLADPLLDLRLIAVTYRSDPRVRLVERAPDSAYPSPFLLTVPVSEQVLGASAVRRLVEYADRDQLGLVRVELEPGGAVELWRTAALGRAGWVRDEGESLAEAVAAVHGAGSLGVDALGAGRWLPASVEVAGFRSLGTATGLVALLAARRARARLGRAFRR